MPEETLLTQEGYQKLSDELTYLRTKKRREIADKLESARAQGDLSENGEYDAAKNEQAQVEERIASLENQIKTAKIIDDQASSNAKEVVVGSRVKILDLEYQEEMTFTIVGTVEANPRKQKISNESPLGRALLGASVGDEVEVDTKAGTVKYQVLDILKKNQ